MLLRIVVASSSYDLPFSLTNLSAAAIRRQTARAVELVDRGLHLTRHGNDRFGRFQHLLAERVEVGSLRLHVFASSDGSAEAVEDLREPVGNQRLGPVGIFASTSAAFTGSTPVGET